MAVVAALAALALAAVAGAGHQTSGVKSYTGCLVSGEGVLIKIKEGNAPRSACTGGQVEAHFSGGDITKISVGSGLSLPNGGDNGEVRIELAASQALPQGCADGRVAEWDSGTSRWICGVDDDTTYTAGTGLDLSAGNALSIEPAYRLPNKACPTAGEFARGFDASGTIQCQAPAPATAGVEVWQKIRPTDTVAGGVIVLPKGEGVDLIAMPLPAGTFLVTAVAPLEDRGDDAEFNVICGLRNGAFGHIPVHASRVDISGESLEAAAVATVHGVVTLASADTVRFTCNSSSGDSDPEQAESATMTAIKVGTLHAP
ncbi:MAG TPA: hypothetical protein VJ807_05765 [Gaiellaceae bacterium]|nr:hypothetical protein [Gaiellaceae bacterium]